MEKLIRLKYYLSDSQIYEFYFGDFEIGKKYESPFPHRDDPNPSFIFKMHDDGGITWNDFGLSGTLRKDAVGFVMEYYGLSKPKAINKIWSDMVLDKSVKVPARKKIKRPINLPYQVKGQPMNEVELGYWKDFLIDPRLLQFYNVSSLRYMRRLDRVVWKTSENNPAFLYEFSKPGAFKAYRPLNPDKGNKWRGQNNGDIVEGYDQLPRNADHLIIQSSLKDTMCFRSMGYLSCNPTSETSFKTLITKVREFNNRFDVVYVLFDNDDPGRLACQELCYKTGWIPIFLPGNWEKDPSDHIKITKTHYHLKHFLQPLNLNTYGRLAA